MVAQVTYFWLMPPEMAQVSFMLCYLWCYLQTGCLVSVHKFVQMTVAHFLPPVTLRLPD